MEKQSRVVVITGASGGIGEAAARAFHANGDVVVLASRNREKLEMISASLPGSFVIATDLSDEESAKRLVSATIEKCGRLDVLVCNAASIIVSPALEVTSEDLLSTFRTNVIGHMVLTQEAIKVMKPRGGGNIINVGSPGFMMGIPFYAPYVTSKAAFSAWTRTLQAELTDEHIYISEYFPGYIRTDSAPVSRIGDIPQDFLMEEKTDFISKYFTRPQSPETVARHLVRISLKPKTLTYSGFTVNLGAWIALFPSFRLKLARGMAENARKKLNKQR